MNRKETIMEKSKIMILVESVIDGTISIGQVWQTYGNEIQNTKNVSTEEEVLALTELYLRYAGFLYNNGYLKDAESYYSEAAQILENKRDALSEDNYEKWIEIPLHSLAYLNSQSEQYMKALGYFKQLKNMFPGKDEYLQAYIACLRNVIAKCTTPIYIVIALIFLLDICESHFLDLHIIPDWVLDASWFIWVIAIIVQFGLPWVLKK